jgi:hypothetical protein
MADGLYLYCVLPAGHAPPPALLGIDDAPVAPVTDGDLVLWTSALPRPPVASIEAIQRHNHVIETAMDAAVTPVPLRFGQYVSPAELAARVADRRSVWSAALAEFAGCAEYGVRVLEPDRAPAARDVRTAPVSGRAYLESLARAAGLDQERRARAESLAATLRARLGDCIVRDRVDPLPSSHGLASIAHLVRSGSVDAYRHGIDAARAAMPALRFLTSGPWPPYSFSA